MLRKPIRRRRVSSELKDQYSLCLIEYRLTVVHVKESTSWVILSVRNIVARATVTTAI